MRRRQPLPEWWSYLLKELTRPPYFLEHILATANNGSSAPAERQSSRGGPAVAPSAPAPSRVGSRNAGAPSAFADARKRPSPGRAVGQGPFVAVAHTNATTSETEARRPWTSVFRRHGFPVSLAKAYGWDVEQATAVGSVLKVRTKRGNYALKQAHIDKARLEFIEQALRYLDQQGFHQFATLVRTDNKLPYAFRDQRVYYATKWIDGSPANFASVVQVGRVARALAQFHALSRGFETTGYNPPPEFGIASMLRSRADDLKDILARAESKQRPDEFDAILVRLAPGLRQDAERAVRIADSQECRSFLVKDEDNPGLCHLDVIPGNFIYTRDRQVYLLDFDLATFAPRVLDMAHLLRRSLQQQNWQSEGAYACFLNYHEVEPIAAEEYLLVQALLTFPYRAWRLAHTRYRVFKDERQVDELRDCAAQETRRQAFLDAYGKQIMRQVD